MNIGWVGLGKLGLPIAEEVARTHRVLGHDVSDERLRLIEKVAYGAPHALLGCDLIFVSVQTPHRPELEGTRPLTDERADFDYHYLVDAVAALAAVGDKRPPLVIVSTVLPGTIEREILPLWDGPVIYNPFFIAMGEEVADFLDPEFVLLGHGPQTFTRPVEGGDETALGSRSPSALEQMILFYRSLGVEAPVLITGYREAELAKMAYNTFIGLKIAFANTIGELCDRLDIDASSVLNIVRAGRKRITSPAYLSAGMGDGGPCHPRDNIALSWLAREADLSFDLFSAVMEQREEHADWLAGLVFAARHVGPLTIIGRAYKAESTLETGSAALLVAEHLRRCGIDFDHVEDLAP